MIKSYPLRHSSPDYLSDADSIKSGCIDLDGAIALHTLEKLLRLVDVPAKLFATVVVKMNLTLVQWKYCMIEL